MVLTLSISPQICKEGCEERRCRCSPLFYFGGDTWAEGCNNPPPSIWAEILLFVGKIHTNFWEYMLKVSGKSYHPPQTNWKWSCELCATRRCKVVLCFNILGYYEPKERFYFDFLKWHLFCDCSGPFSETILYPQGVLNFMVKKYFGWFWWMVDCFKSVLTEKFHCNL